MIEYVVPGNIDDRILERSARLLGEGGVIALPSDTSWIAVCSLDSKAGLKKLRRISRERDERHFTLLCSDISQFSEFCRLDNTRFRLIKRLSPGPYVFILKTLLGTEKVLNLKRGEVGVRIPNHPVPLALIRTMGKPLYSITAKKNTAENSFEEPGEETLSIPEESLFEGGWELEALEGIDLILDTGDERPRTFSTILDLGGDEAVLLRSGEGPWPL